MRMEISTSKLRNENEFRNLKSVQERKRNSFTTTSGSINPKFFDERSSFEKPEIEECLNIVKLKWGI